MPRMWGVEEMRMPGVKDCTTCAYGVMWARAFPGDPLSGRCRWEIPVPHPDLWVQMEFSCSSEPKKNCPAWKKEKDARKLQLRQQWKEEPEAFRERLDVERKKLLAQYAQKHGGLNGCGKERANDCGQSSR